VQAKLIVMMEFIHIYLLQDCTMLKVSICLLFRLVSSYAISSQGQKHYS